MLREEFLKPMGLTAYRVAKELHVSLPRINDLIHERRAMTADTALRLERYLGMPAQFWMAVQADYDIRLAAKKPELAKIKRAKPTGTTSARQSGTQTERTNVFAS